MFLTAYIALYCKVFIFYILDLQVIHHCYCKSSVNVFLKGYNSSSIFSLPLFLSSLLFCGTFPTLLLNVKSPLQQYLCNHLRFVLFHVVFKTGTQASKCELDKIMKSLHNLLNEAPVKRGVVLQFIYPSVFPNGEGHVFNNFL